MNMVRKSAMAKKKVLLVGESWVSASVHYKGFDQFSSASSHSGAQPLTAALATSSFELVHMRSQDAVQSFPFDEAGLDPFAAIILSDIGSNSFLLPEQVWLRGETVPNRLKLIRDWTAKGRGLVMVGGYLSFQGIDGRARWRRTAVEEALPVECLPYDDRVEIPEGMRAEIVESHHPVLAGVGADWPVLLGLNEVRAKSGAGIRTIARAPEEQGGHPLLVVGPFGKGRSAAWTSDIGPHWLPNRFAAWPGFAHLWSNLLTWVTDVD
jgi:uncharacterized membrane protein